MHLLFENWHELFGGTRANILLAFVAVLCGSIAGAEREKKEKPAGLRTLTLVCLGSAVFTMVSISISLTQPAYIAAQIVTGIGFLGAGAILRGNLGVTGLTTAATIWVTAATGMVIGVGYAGAGLALSLLVLAVLTVIGTFEKRHLDSCSFTSATVIFDRAGGKTLIKIEEAIEGYHTNPRLLAQATPEGFKQLQLTYCNLHRHHHEFLVPLADMPEVREIRRDNPAAGLGEIVGEHAGKPPAV